MDNETYDDRFDSEDFSGNESRTPTKLSRFAHAGTIQVYSDKLFEDLLASSTYEPYRTKKELTLEQKAIIQERKEKERQKKNRLKKRMDEMKKNLEYEDRKIRKAVQNNMKNQEKKFWKKIQEVEDGLEFSKNVIKFLEEEEINEYRKKENLFREWEQNVYQSIQNKIKKKISTISTAELEDRRRELFEEYLNATNTNKGMFLDIIKKEEYDPLKGRKNYPKVSIKNINENDPLKRELYKMNQEQRDIIEISKGGTYNPEKSIGRETFAPNQWNKASSTVAYLGDGAYKGNPKSILSGFGAKEPPRRQGKSIKMNTSNLSSMNMDHFKISHDPSLVKNEYFPRGKKVYSPPTLPPF